MLQARLISSLVFAVLFLVGLFIPAFLWIIPLILAGATLWGVHEFMHFGQYKPARPYVVLAMLASLLLLADAYCFGLTHATILIGALTVLILFTALALKDPHMAEVSGLALISTLYVAIPMALITVILFNPLKAQNPNAQHYLLFLILVTWSSDVGAYTFGRLFGKHKLAPAVSPGKTVEGFIGGIVMTVAIAASMKLCWNNIDRIFAWWEVIVLAIVFSTIGPVGDLAESWLKRSSGIKDSGRTFTGHGGMLDIIDSLLFTTVFYYAYLWHFHPSVVV